MSNRLLFVACLLFTTAVFAQNSQLTWKPVKGAWGYRIEIQNDAGKQILVKETTGTTFNAKDFPPGEYRFRISSINKIRKVEGTSAWIPFRIEKALVPEIDSLSTETIFLAQGEQRITVSGKGFSKKTRFILQSGSLRKNLEISSVTYSSAVLIYTPDEKLPSSYKIIAINPGEFSSKENVSVSIIAKQPITVAKDATILPKDATTPPKDAAVVLKDSVSTPKDIEAQPKDAATSPEKTDVAVKDSSASTKDAVVIVPKNPVIKKVKPSLLKLTTAPVEFTIIGENLSSDTSYLIRSDKVKKTVKPSTTGESKQKISIAGSDLPEGDYFISAIDAKGKQSEEVEAFKIVQQIRGIFDNNIYLTLYPIYNMPLPVWHKYFENSYTSFGVALSKPVSDKFDFVAEGDYVSFKPKTVFNMVERKMKAMSFGLGSGYRANLFSGTENYIDLITRFTFGLAYSSLETKNYLEVRQIQSLDFYFSLSESLRFRLFHNYIFEPDVEMKCYLFKEKPLYDLRGSLRFGIVL